MSNKKTVLVRAPKHIMKILENKLPNVKNNSDRISVLYDTSLIKLDNWLGQPAIKKKK